MYQVVKIYGDWEPWWSLENWQEDIIETKCFDDFEEARAFYHQECQTLKSYLPSCKCHDNFQAAFWNQEDQRWCEMCGSYLQQYHSIVILEDGRELSKEALSY